MNKKIYPKFLGNIIFVFCFLMTTSPTQIVRIAQAIVVVKMSLPIPETKTVKVSSMENKYVNKSIFIIITFC